MRIVIDGNIGSGKTTQLNLFERSGYLVKREPLDLWPLAKFYSNRKRWALALQIRILQTLQPEDAVIYERSLISSRYVFWEHVKPMITPIEKQIYEDAYEKYKWQPDMYIYLHKTPEQAYAHIQHRGQTGDKSITLEYLRELDDLYEKMLKTMSKVHRISTFDKSPAEIHQEILSLLRVDEVHLPNDERS